MPQQINLSLPTLMKPRQQFSAKTMAQALAVFLLFGGGLCAWWVSSLRNSSEGYRQALSSQTQELATLQAALERGKAGVGAVSGDPAPELQAVKADLVRRESVLAELQRGVFRDGLGQSARLQLVAQTIPAQVWVTQIKADDMHLDVSGLTLEPDALNAWMSRLSGSELLRGQRLTTVKVERVDTSSPDIAPSALRGASPAVASVQKPMWSFSLVSAQAAGALVAGGKP